MKTPPQSSGNGSLPAANKSRGRDADLRELQIHERLSECTHQRKRNATLPLWNCVTLGKELGYSRQCILNDIEHMIAKGYPIAKDSSLKGYYYTQSFTPMLAQVITESELTRLFFAIRAVEALQDSPVFAPVLADLQKLISALIERLGLDYESLSSCVTIKNTGIDPYVDPEVLEKLIIAIRERQELEITYSKLNYDDEPCSNGSLRRSPKPPQAAPDADPSTEDGAAVSAKRSLPEEIPHPSAPWLPLQVERRIAHPLHILSLDHVWYLYLWDPMRKAIRRFMLSRMHAITGTGESFRARKFDLEKEIAKSFGVTSGEPVTVRVQFRGKASYLVAERPWHHSQVLAPGPNSEWNVELTLKVALTPELMRWIFGYDQDARVIEPAALRDAIAARAGGIRPNYDSE